MRKTELPQELSVPVFIHAFRETSFEHEYYVVNDIVITDAK